MKVADAMTREVRIVRSGDTLESAAAIMAEEDIGFLPVEENDRLVGMLTDRDIAVRATACGRGPSTPVAEIMSKEVKYCFEDEELDDATQNMGELQIRRLPVLNREKRLVGVLSLADAALSYSSAAAGKALCAIVEPGGDHSQNRAG